MTQPQPDVTLNNILITEELSERSPRSPDWQAEVQAMQTLARQMANNSDMLQTVVEMAVELCQAGSAGVSLDDGNQFCHYVLAGTLTNYVGSIIPRNNPYGVCLDCGSPVLFSYPERYFTYLQATNTPFVEKLVLPLIAQNHILGTIWIVSHSKRHFDREDVRVMTSLADFTATALQMNQPQTKLLATNAKLKSEAVERQAGEALLRESEEQFRNMADNAPVLVWVTDPTGYCTYLSQKWYEFTGQTEETGLGFGWVDAVHSEDREYAKKTFIAANESHQTFRLDYRLRRFDGEYRFCIDAASPWFGVDGGFKGFIGSVIDITERKRTEEALRVNEERYRTLFESIDEGFCVIQMLFDENDTPIDYRFLEINHVFEEQTGLRQVIGKTVRQLVPNLEAHWIQIYGNVALTGEPARFENGSEALNRWFDVYACRIGESAARQVAIVFKDISDRKQAELEIRKFVSLADNSTEFIGICDLSLVAFYVNQAGLEMTGLENLAQYNEVPVLEFFFAEDRDFINNEFFPRVLREGRAEVEIRFRHFKTGEAIWMIYNVFYIEDENKPIGLATVSRNITDRKRVELERDQLLEREQAARAEAEHANRIKDEFLAVLSHELRTPLNPILGWTKILQTGKLNETKTAQALATIERNVKLQTQLIDDLLDVAKILRGKLSLNINSVDLPFVIEAALDTVRTAATAKSISVYSVLPDVRQVSGDAARLQQIIWNLVSNAIKFTPNGGRVDIRLEKVDSLAEITVKDTGKGISPGFLPHIFESFCQEDASTTRKYGGLGLGLAIVRQLVEAHGGTITAHSPGKGLGATFTVRLPLSIESQIKQDLLQPKLDLTGIRVLAVDDEPDSRELLTVLLTQYKAEVLTVADAAQVLANLESFQPDVLIGDIGMPEVDGFNLIQQIRALSASQGGQIPAIALTAYAKLEDKQRALNSGYQQHLTKPFDPEELVQAVAALTKK